MRHRTAILLLGPAFFLVCAGAKTVTISSGDGYFSPASATIAVGDVVRFDLGGSHSALEVSQATYNANGNTALQGGFHAPFGGGNVSNLKAGVHYYICENHYDTGMKGRITVQGASGISVPLRPAGKGSSVRIVDLNGRVLAEGNLLAAKADLAHGVRLTAGPR